MTPDLQKLIFRLSCTAVMPISTGNVDVVVNCLFINDVQLMFCLISGWNFTVLYWKHLMCRHFVFNTCFILSYHSCLCNINIFYCLSDGEGLGWPVLSDRCSVISEALDPASHIQTHLMASMYPPSLEESAEVKEGFLCPLCLKDLQSFYQLQDHYEEEHSGDNRHVSGQLKSKLYLSLFGCHFLLSNKNRVVSCVTLIKV